jgi:serine/threonine protein kinase
VYISKLLRANDIPNCVLAEENVIVMPKEGSPPAVFDILSKAGPVPFYLGLCQEFMNGGSLEGDANEGKLSPKVLFSALADVATALAGMHACGVQHRDVKPENVMFAKKDGQITKVGVCDFGSGEVGENRAGEADDIRRFGVTVFSVVTATEWTKEKLIREPHENIISGFKEFVKDKKNPAIKKAPQVVEKILAGNMNMAQVLDQMVDLANIA